MAGTGDRFSEDQRHIQQLIRPVAAEAGGGRWRSSALLPATAPASAIFTMRSYLGATRLLGGNEPAAPTGSILIEVISSPLGETNIAKLGPSGPPGGPSTV
jgi:hypothetical protein